MSIDPCQKELDDFLKAVKELGDISSRKTIAIEKIGEGHELNVAVMGNMTEIFKEEEEANRRFHAASDALIDCRKKVGFGI